MALAIYKRVFALTTAASRRHQFDFYLATQRAGGFAQRVQRDRGIGGIQQPGHRRPARFHPHCHFSLVSDFSSSWRLICRLIARFNARASTSPRMPSSFKKSRKLPPRCFLLLIGFDLLCEPRNQVVHIRSRIADFRRGMAGLPGRSSELLLNNASGPPACSALRRGSIRSALRAE